MRNVLQDEGSTGIHTAGLGWAALVGFLLVLPLAILESMNQIVSRQNAPGLIVLFGLLWLMPTAIVVIILKAVRNLRAGHGVMGHPLSVLLWLASVVLIAGLWGSLVVDQMPCFLGVPNCD